MNLRLELPNDHKKFKPEMFATIRVYSEPEPNVLMVPERAVQRDRDRRFVFVQREPNTFETRDVRLGQSNGQYVKILDGLVEGESIVTNGAFILKSEKFGEQI
jgi:cobalt-zinc-cadmium efflux system membrane fusion protein